MYALLDAFGSGWWHGPDGGAGPHMAYGSPHLPDGIRDGATLLGKYRVGAVLGWGATGTVVAAHHLHLEKDVAIKFLRPEATGHKESLARFYREARTADRIRGDHVARIFDVGTLETGEPYIVMEHLRGCDLARWLDRHGPLPVAQAVDFVLQACDALAQAHDLGIVHRDLKPANLFVVERPGESPLIKVLDFGIAKNTGFVPTTLTPGECLAESVITEERALLGTPLYMSPEQLSSSREVDARTDVWALGVVLFQLVTGKLPFEGSFLDICARVASPLRPREELAGLPPNLAAIVFKCLERDRELRYRSARALADALRKVSAGAEATDANATLPSFSAPRRRVSRLKNRTVVAGVAALLAATAIAFYAVARMLPRAVARPAAVPVETSRAAPVPVGPARSEEPVTTAHGLEHAPPSVAAVADPSEPATTGVGSGPSPSRESATVPPPARGVGGTKRTTNGGDRESGGAPPRAPVRELPGGEGSAPPAPRVPASPTQNVPLAPATPASNWPPDVRK